MDDELVEMFIEEVGQLKGELTPIFESLKTNNQQPELFTNFAQIIDRIYGTATTMGFDEIGEYLGAIRNLARKTASSNVPRGMQEVFKMLKTCMEHFDTMQSSLTNPTELTALITKMKLEMKKADKIEKEIFAFSKKAKTILT